MFGSARPKANRSRVQLAVGQLEDREAPSVIGPPHDIWPIIGPPPVTEYHALYVWVKTGPGGAIGSQR